MRFAALGDSLTEGVGDPVGEGLRGWAELLAPCFSTRRGVCGGGVSGGGVREGGVREGGVREGGVREVPVEFRNFAVSGAQSADVWERQTPRALEFAPDVAAVVVGVNDTLRRTFDIDRVTARLDRVYGAFAAGGAQVLTACLPDPGALLGLPGTLARPLARRQRAVNTVVHALSARYGAVHVHAADAEWVADRSLWSADRLHPGERGHRALAVRFHAELSARGWELGPAPSRTPEQPAPTHTAALWWLATAGTGWVLRRSTDLLPQLACLAADEARHAVRGTAARLDRRAAAAASAALAV
ncbi:SGNH/GDSL hydrolase family protein, partial [Streptomyces sp. YC537]|nr:SGNH/GDSL hydrolase family protein [Streptomyces boluensis]